LIERLQSTKDTKEIPPDWTDSDMIESIIKKLIPNDNFKHVKGHQIQQESSPIEVYLNIQVDEMANKAINSNITTENPETALYISVTQKRLFKRSHIISHCATQQSILYHQRKYGKTYRSIDWELYKHIIKQINHQEFSFLRSQKFENMRRKITQARPDEKYSQEEY
jgi:hypothetical protein